MRFWKTTLLSTSIVVAAIAGIVTYSSCEKDACTNVSCQHGGSCNNGACKCPTGYDDPTCGTRTTDRFAGTYAGFTTCNNSAQVIDTLFILGNVPHQFLSVQVTQKTHNTDVLFGVVNTNETTYALDFPTVYGTHYSKTFHATLQSSTKLVFDTYEYDTNTMAGPIVNKCTFVGFKK